MSVVIETTLGDITVDLFLADRPRACLNFLKLCKIKYYNYNLFHTISRGFIAQTGDPTGSRKGGESLYGVLDGPEKRYFEGEDEPRIKHTKMGLISFVGNDERMIGSQFFITLGEDLTYLDQKHCVFGEVVEGMDILEIINEAICDTDDRPYQDIRITHTVILDDPYPDPKRLKVPSRSPSPSVERLQGGRIAPDEDIDEMEGKSAHEVAETQAEREAKARATILEMVGDLPDADMAPPENVLFVCKLNPITTDDDLEIIFNRFGKIVSCEVIRDKKTGDSLQYAFIEFEDRKSCEDAYFKMDNILIDDRRIHVDFSQSVSKVKWHGKGRGVTHFDERGRKTAQGNKDIGKGNYKLDNSARESRQNNRERDAKRKEEKYRDINKENNSRNKNGRDFKKHSRSRSRSPRRYEEVHRRRERSPRGSRNRSRSRSPRRRPDDRWVRPSNRGRYDSRREDSARRRYEENRRGKRSRSPDRREKEQLRFEDNRSSSLRYQEKYQKMERYNESRNRGMKKSSEAIRELERSDKYSRSKKKIDNKASKQKNEDTGSESSDNKLEEKKTKNSKHKAPKKRKTRKESTESESDSDTESSESSESEKEKRKSRKKRKDDSSESSSNSESRKKKKKRKPSTESELESDSSESNEGKDEEQKKRKHKRRTKTSSESESSEEERKRGKKKKKRKN